MNLKKYKLFAIPVILILIQFFQPAKNSMGIGENHIINETSIADTVKNMLSVSCFDCHSNQTNYHWYHKISPVSWIINGHINEGKEELNFSNWKSMDVYDKIAILDEICEEVKDKKMPLKAYSLIHNEAKLSEEQIKTLCDWTSQYSELLLKENKQ
ncbi:heme-binding domain-containing protein [Plebeiibacterium sediminum]|uniref:Heme-binding domain-containing protein n=1 Tax=Plebeiibacterium sediminum TaxID=2992112 RepID=A0AAE3M1T5_9BACT|nr:heme-binding domain-containing protein [Plebeiobacterium sediminum]MCW3785376.1 heme-binding domain-containing protein [Plebeiobacterium sediminum]